MDTGPLPTTGPRPLPVAAGADRVRDVLPAVVGQLPVGVALIRPDLSLAYHNEAFSQVLGLREAAALVGAPPARIDAGPLISARRADGSRYDIGDDPIDAALRDGRTTGRERMIVERSDGSLGVVLVNAAPIRAHDDVIIAAVAYVSDAADLGEPTLLADAVSLREAFVGVLSHELRTPITSIYGGTQLLLGDRLTIDERSTLLGDIAAEAEALELLVEDLLAIARLERGGRVVGSEPVNLRQVVEPTIAGIARRWPDREIVLETPPDLPAVLGENEDVRQVVRNLLGHAVRHSPERSVIHVLVTPLSEVVEVRIQDDGSGFPAELGDDVFRLFHRRPDLALHFPGTGIGLYVARTLVKAMGGTIWLRNRSAGGTEVGFGLPRYPVVAA